MINFDNTYSKLPEEFFELVNPEEVPNPSLVKFNDLLAEELNLNLNELSNEEKASIFSGNVIAKGSQPIAQVYAGHQFGHFVPRLGDGRAILLGEVIDKNGIRKDIQLKGSGVTKYSRSGDGKAPISAVIREYIISEAIHSLNIPTTRSLSIVTTGENIYREETTPGAILCRVASSHIRIGTFEYFAARNDIKSLKILFIYTLKRHYPEINENHITKFFDIVVDNQAKLIAKWMSIGFIHGVMNTDNSAISGETIDYGPCAFMDTFEENKVFSSIDMYGRYSYSNQSKIIEWNLSKLKDCLRLILDNEQQAILMDAILDGFEDKFMDYYFLNMNKKIGLNSDDDILINDFLKLMEENKVDFTLAFRYLCDSTEKGSEELKTLFKNNTKLDNWLIKWHKILKEEKLDLNKIKNKMKLVNPLFIPRNHRVQEVIDAAIKKDYSKLNKLLKILSNPFEEQKENNEYINPPKPDEVVHQTFCGT